MLFKMFGIERAYTQQSEISSVARPRQIFVTRSSDLVTRIEAYFSKLLASLAATTKSKEELKEIAEQQKLQNQGDGLLYDAVDDVTALTGKAGLPQKFSLLRDEHFPLFLTFEQLCQLLEGDIDNTLDVAGNSKGQLVTYNIFFKQYWPQFSKALTKNLDPALVFSEILSVIKGSEQSLSHETRYLDLKAYKNLTHHTQHWHGFAKQWDQIYSLFQAYTQHKTQHGEYDSADRTHNILKAFDVSGIPGAKIDYLYVDEAQDNLLIDAMLLQLLCHSPDGLFWAGDAAQAITIGGSLRFNDLKAFLYRLEQCREQGEASITQSKPRTFQLSMNYRSHGGIVRCAATVIMLMTYFWPSAIDSFTPEQAIVDGAKPVFFSGWNIDTMPYHQILSGDFGDSGERIEFGPRQCILVRDEAAKSELQKQVGDIGLILTLYESKGLEFDDVGDSTVDLEKWRVLLNLLETPTYWKVHAPCFNKERHAGVCSELKFLYVAITRARRNLWIIDCSDKAEPMKMLWDSKGYIQICTPGDVPRLAVRSTPEEWNISGRAMFRIRRYLQAKHAFERAGRARDAKISYTYHLRDTAHSIRLGSKEAISAKRNAFCSAAESFLEKTEMFDEAIHVIQKHRHEVDEELANNVQEEAKLFYFKNKELRKAETLFESVEEQLEYLEDSHLDERVQYCSTEKPNLEKPPPENIRRVFKNLDDAPSALSVSEQANPPFVPGSRGLRANSESGGNSTVEAQGDGPSGMEQLVEQQIKQPEAVLTDLTRKDLVLRLLHVYRQRVRNKDLEKHKTITQKNCDSYFETCLKLASDSKEMQWPCGSYYRKLYLGLVPHLLACVKAVESYALSAWSEARDQSRKEKQDYDGMYKTKSEIIAILKESRKLGSRLGPSSEVHKKRDIEGLKQLAREVEQLVNRVPSGAGLDVHFNLQLAMKGVMNARPERG
ncbi:hypothetical protein EST38_g11041 [Candolleomyces aberdarensis]|uniref:Uncharacterized protein n=1 Tax=Candolleomyces aberdarensis TaxID=2316362 RepID=A0A4Q2D5V2_9AGAR|nr:hypothetical protein EST38_g11041 [Candolleomyces aberdarensis]